MNDSTCQFVWKCLAVSLVAEYRYISCLNAQLYIISFSPGTVSNAPGGYGMARARRIPRKLFSNAKPFRKPSEISWAEPTGERIHSKPDLTGEPRKPLINQFGYVCCVCYQAMLNVRSFILCSPYQSWLTSISTTTLHHVRQSPLHRRALRTHMTSGITNTTNGACTLVRKNLVGDPTSTTISYSDAAKVNVVKLPVHAFHNFTQRFHQFRFTTH